MARRKLTPVTVYAVVRVDKESGDEWPDLGTVSLLAEESRRQADHQDRRARGWAEKNPVRRLGHFRLAETAPGSEP